MNIFPINDVTFKNVEEIFSENQTPEFQMLSERLIIFDICEEKKIIGSLSYEQCHEKILSLKPIRKPEDQFKIALSVSDESELIK